MPHTLTRKRTACVPRDDTLQTRRRANLRHQVILLQKDGLTSWDLIGQLVAGVDGETLTAFLRDEPITDARARDIEWHANRPTGWMDAEWDCPLDD